MKKLLYLFFVLLLFSCRKEVGEKYYIFTLNFSNGNVITRQVRIYEKPKNYKNVPYGFPNKIQMSQNKDVLFISWFNDSFFNLIKDGDNLVGASFFTLNLEGICSSAKGTISFNGGYSQKFRIYEVKNGTFEFDWINAEDYGQTDQTLTGTWTLKRD